MHRFRILRIVLMIAVIFAAGIGIGYRFIQPPVPDVTLKVLGKEGTVISADVVVAYYDRELHLTEAQKQNLHLVAAEFVQKLSTTQPRTRERFDVFRTYFPKVRALLEGDQLPKFDELTKRHRARMDRSPE